MDEFKREMKSLSLDERDSYPDFAMMVKMEKDDLKHYSKDEYEEMLSAAKNAVECADDLARQYRRQDSRKAIGEAEDDFEQSMRMLEF